MIIPCIDIGTRLDKDSGTSTRRDVMCVWRGVEGGGRRTRKSCCLTEEINERKQRVVLHVTNDLSLETLRRAKTTIKTSR